MKVIENEIDSFKSRAASNHRPGAVIKNLAACDCNRGPENQQLCLHPKCRWSTTYFHIADSNWHSFKSESAPAVYEDTFQVNSMMHMFPLRLWCDTEYNFCVI